MNLESVTKSFV